MEEPCPPCVEPAVFEANMAALRSALPLTARRISDSQPPEPLTLTTARDGSPTYAWTDRAGSRCWLGRTTMPAIRAEALVASFQHAGANALLYGIGQGETLRRLLLEMSAYQAVMVIEREPWILRAVLGLHDFAADIDRRRLTLFTGPEAWEDGRAFFLSEEGFLAPRRMLAWPWFDPETIALASDRLAAVQTAVAEDRAARRGASKPEKTTVVDSQRRPRVAVIAHAPDVTLHGLAHRIESAAESLGVSFRRFVLDDPRWVHPAAIEKALREFAPSVLVLLDTVPDASPYALPAAPILILATHADRLSEALLGRLPHEALLAVRTQAQERNVIEYGLDPSRVVLLPPAAMLHPSHKPSSRGNRLCVWADEIDVSAKAAGLHLNSHRRLWQAARKIIQRKLDAYTDDDAEKVIAGALSALTMRLSSDEVRNGLIQRVRDRLGPGLVRRAYCMALARQGLAFSLYGRGWTEDETLAAHHQGASPPFAHDGSVAPDYGAMIFLDTSGTLPERLLDAMASGLTCMVRRHPRDKTSEGIAAVLDADAHVVRFAARDACVQQASRFLTDPASFAERAESAAQHVLSAHTWDHRLEKIMELLQEPTPPSTSPL